jgi:hypothetical protein
MKVRVGHAERLEDVRLDKDGLRLAARPLDDGRKQRVRAVVVFEFGTRDEIEPRARARMSTIC